MEEQKSRLMSKTEFWVRLGIWSLFAIVAPLVFIAIRYGLFVSEEAKTSLSGWGLLGVVVVAFVMMNLVIQARKGLAPDSMVAQCVDGFMCLIPLIALIFGIEAIKTTIVEFQQTLIFITLSEAIAIPVNPMRRWGYQNNIERADNFFSGVIKRALGKTK